MQQKIHTNKELIDNHFRKHLKNGYQFIDKHINYPYKIEEYDKDFQNIIGRKLKFNQKMLAKIAIQQTENFKKDNQQDQAMSVDILKIKQEYKQREVQFLQNQQKYIQKINQDFEQNVLEKLRNYLGQIKSKEECNQQEFKKKDVVEKLERVEDEDGEYYQFILQRLKSNLEQVEKYKNLMNRFDESLDCQINKIERESEKMFKYKDYIEKQSQ